MASVEASFSTTFGKPLTNRRGAANAKSRKKLSKLVVEDIPLVWLKIIAVLSILAAIPAIFYCCWHIGGYHVEPEKFHVMSGIATLFAVGPMIYWFFAYASSSGSDGTNLVEDSRVKHPTKNDEEISRRWYYFLTPIAPIFFFLVGFGYQIWSP